MGKLNLNDEFKRNVVQCAGACLIGLTLPPPKRPQTLCLKVQL